MFLSDMKKIATALFLTVFFTGLGFCEDNLGRAVYAVYSENFNGLKYVDIGDTPWDPGSIDNVHIYAWGSYQDGFLSTATYSSFSERLDGNTYWQLKGFGAAYGGGANFISNPVRMIEYANGTYEFYARASTDDVLDIRIGMSSVYSAVGEKLMTLRSAGLTANGQWQKIVIPLATLGINELALYDGIIYPFLFSVPASVSASSALDLDCIVIKKASGGSFSATIKNVDSSDSTTPENITWGNDALGNRWYAAKQYIELNLDILPTYSSTVGTSSPVTIVNWGIQLYTEVKNSTPAYTGELTADDAY